MRDLESGPRGGHEMCEQRRENVRNRLVQEGHDRHAKHPKLEGDEYYVFTFGIVETVVDVLVKTDARRSSRTHMDTGQFNDQRQLVLNVAGVLS